MKLLVIGGNAAGMSAASRVKRRAPSWEVLVLERSREVSYGACGLPYYVAGLNNDIDLIRIRSVADFEKAGVQVRLSCTVTSVDFSAKTVSYTGPDGREGTENYDKLLIATGSSPKIPPIPGIRQDGILPLKTLAQAESLRFALEAGPKNVVIVGGGYIGLELAEACHLQNVPSIRVIEAADRLLNGFDPEFSQAVQQELERNQIQVHTGERVLSFEGNSRVEQIVTNKGRYPADLVILALGVDPNTRFLGSEVEKLPGGAIVTSGCMETSVPDVYAAGDCATVWHKLLDRPVPIALGTNANKQGRLAGDNIIGRKAEFKRALGTSMLRCLGLELAKTGLGQTECEREGVPFKTATVQTRSHARYYPDPQLLTIKLCYRSEDRVLLGAQIMGPKEAALRIDTFACAIDQGMSTSELGFLDLGYAPPFASVWDAVAIAANASK